MKCDIGSICLLAQPLVCHAGLCVPSGGDWLQNDVADNSRGDLQLILKETIFFLSPVVHIDGLGMKIIKIK